MGLFGRRKAGKPDGEPIGRVNLYCIYDRVAEDSGPPFAAKNDGVAQRELRHLLDNVPVYDRDAFKLCRIGSWDSSTMTGELYEMPDVIEIADARIEETNDGA